MGFSPVLALGGIADEMLNRLRAAWAFLLLLGCAPSERDGNLVELGEIRPRHLEAGDRLRISGSGYPAGPRARVVLRGDLLRAGEHPVRAVEIHSVAELSSPHTLEMAASAPLIRELCGEPDARHTTFRGDLEVWFEPNTSTGTAVGGLATGVVLDFTPEAIPRSTLARLRTEGERYARFLGVKVTRAEGGIMLTAVEKASRASRGGLDAGDLVTELHGMATRDVADFIPPPNARSSAALVQRGAEQLPVRLDSAGFRYQPPGALGGAVLLIGLVVAPWILLVSMPGRLLFVLERRVVERLRAARIARSSHEPGVSLGRSLLDEVGRQVPNSFLFYFTFAAINALFGLVAFGLAVVARELDLLVLTAAAAASLIGAALASGGAGPRWSLRAGCRGALSALLLSLPPALALLLAITSSASLRPADWVASQGSAPWHWRIFETPISMLAGILAFLAMVPSIRPAPSHAIGAETAGGRLLAITEWSHKLVGAGLLSIALLGGWQLPGTPGSLAMATAGAALFVAKTWLVLSGVLFMRWVLGAIDAGFARWTMSLWLALPSLMCVPLALSWQGLRRSPALATVDSQFGPILFGTGLALLFCLLSRTWIGGRIQGGGRGTQSWL